MTQESLTKSPTHAGFLSGGTWEGLQQPADGRGFPPGSAQFPPSREKERKLSSVEVPLVKPS